MCCIRIMSALTMVAVLHVSATPAHAGAPQPVTVDCNTGTLVLDKPGSYVLTADATNCAQSPAISISAPAVVLDLGGHTVGGQDQNGTIGIFVDGEKVVVRNGTVQDFGIGILFQGSKGLIDDMDVLSNMNDGMEILDGSVVSNSRFVANVGDGLEAGDGNTLRHNVFAFNLGHGAFLDDRNVLVGNTASQNGARGFLLGDDSKVLRNVAAYNAAEGFETFERSLFKGNTAASNTTNGIFVNGGGSRLTGNVALGNGNNGLTIGNDNLVEKNRVSGNQGVGIFGNRGTFKGNEISGNGSTGLLIGDGATALKNTCTGNRWGIRTRDGVTSVTLAGNVLTANAEDGIFVPELLDPAATQIVKNVTIGNSRQGIDLPDGVVPGAGVGKNTAQGNLEQPQCDAGLCRE